MEDNKNSIQIPGLTEKNSTSAKDLLQIMDTANSNRTTHATVANDTSSRSHAICQVNYHIIYRFLLKNLMMILWVNLFLLILLEVKELKILKAITDKEGCKVQKLTKGKSYIIVVY
eukprot:GHVR01159705.1.p2 GENE.GHVR01159705.1~~GHVR01159705.1.p2  ORF type:complete len:116 (-),score=3.14 GHVR01159705.1:8969-9316(-)